LFFDWRPSIAFRPFGGNCAVGIEKRGRWKVTELKNPPVTPQKGNQEADPGLELKGKTWANSKMNCSQWLIFLKMEDQN